MSVARNGSAATVRAVCSSAHSRGPARTASTPPRCRRMASRQNRSPASESQVEELVLEPLDNRRTSRVCRARSASGTRIAASSAQARLRRLPRGGVPLGPVHRCLGRLRRRLHPVREARRRPRLGHAPPGVHQRLGDARRRPGLAANRAVGLRRRPAAPAGTAGRRRTIRPAPRPPPPGPPGPPPPPPLLGRRTSAIRRVFTSSAARASAAARSSSARRSRS